MSELIGKRREELKNVIRKLHDGENPENVKEEFKELIKGVSAEEISVIEQEMVEEGLSMTELQKFCDAHLEVFRESLHEETKLPEGHPIKILMEEHNHFLQTMNKLKNLAEHCNENNNSEQIKNILHELKESEKHYLREENALFPYLEKHGIVQPPKIMWMDHDFIRDIKKEIYHIYNSQDFNSLKEKQEEFYKKIVQLFDTLTSHFFKENNILFPSAIKVIDKIEWRKIKEDFDRIGYCCVHPKNSEHFGDFDKHEYTKPVFIQKDKITLPTGNFTIEELFAILNALPVDITFIDKDDTVRYYNETKDKIFIRTESIIGRKVQLCHPQKSVHLVNKILEEFKSGKRDKAEFWINFEDKFVFIRYFPITDMNGDYFGCIEVTQDITDIKKLKGEKRLI